MKQHFYTYLFFSILLILLIAIVVYISFDNNKQEHYQCPSAFNGCAGMSTCARGVCPDRDLIGCSRLRKHSRQQQDEYPYDQAPYDQKLGCTRTWSNYIPGSPFVESQNTMMSSYVQRLPAGGAYFNVGK